MLIAAIVVECAVGHHRDSRRTQGPIASLRLRFRLCDLRPLRSRQALWLECGGKGSFHPLLV